MNLLSRPTRAAAFPLVPLVLFLGVVFTATTVVPASKAGRDADSITANKLKPSACSALTLAGITTGSGTINDGAASQSRARQRQRRHDARQWRQRLHRRRQLASTRSVATAAPMSVSAASAPTRSTLPARHRFSRQWPHGEVVLHPRPRGDSPERCHAAACRRGSRALGRREGGGLRARRGRRVEGRARRGATALCVATLPEALHLRAALRNARIIVMGPVSEREIGEARVARLELVAADERIPEGVRVHLKLDTGMGRWGVAELASPSRDVVGVMSHLASAEADPAFTQLQVERFREATAGSRFAYAPSREQRCRASLCRGAVRRRALRHRALRDLAVRLGSGRRRARARSCAGSRTSHS